MVESVDTKNDTADTKDVDAQTAATQDSKDASTSAATDDKPAYSGDLGDIEYTFLRDTPVEQKIVPTFTYGRRVRIAALFQNHQQFLNHLIEVAGWARTTRLQGKELMFVELTDGSCSNTLQVVVTSAMPEFADISKSLTGSSHKFKGKLIESPAKGQLFELQVCEPSVHSSKVIGHCDGKTYPIAKSKKKISNEILREQAHLRSRTKLISAVTRVRNNLAYATHKFFQERGFQYIHTPIITASDCEGAGEMFQVTTALPKPEDPISKMKLFERVGQEEEERKAREAIKKADEAGGKGAAEGAKAKGGAKKEGEGKISKSYAKKMVKKYKSKGQEVPPEILAALADDDEGKQEQKKEGEDGAGKQTEEVKKEEEKKVEMIPLEDRKVNYFEDFFSKPAFLTVSGQINVEAFNCGVGDVYTFGPTFRAEVSHTTRHLAEFWMIEPELAFAELSDVMDCAEDYIKYCLRYVLVNNADDVDFFDQWVSKGLKARLQNVVETEVKRLTYTEAIQILEDHLAQKKITFEDKPFWGVDMGSEHEKYLAEKVFGGPIIVYDYPKSFKAFYMKQNEDEKTVQAMDLLVPHIGELVGGSTREDNLEKLDKMILEKGLDVKDYQWYRELRMYGTQPHGGFGLGFERLVMMATGVENIRDVIPFPRFPGRADF